MRRREIRKVDLLLKTWDRNQLRTLLHTHKGVLAVDALKNNREEIEREDKRKLPAKCIMCRVRQASSSRRCHRFLPPLSLAKWPTRKAMAVP